jgi:hypothetical protein
LGKEAPGLVNLELNQERFITKEEFPLRVTVFDQFYDPLNFAEVTGIITNPMGETQEVKFIHELNDTGEYTYNFVPQRSGIYQITIRAHKENKLVGEIDESLLSRFSKQEYYNAGLKKDFLKNLAEVTGGKYYPPENAADIPLNMKSKKTSKSILSSEYIWDIPFLFFLVVFLLSFEWVYRRRMGLP